MEIVQTILEVASQHPNPLISALAGAGVAIIAAIIARKKEKNNLRKRGFLKDGK